ncbi:hypothetical protein GCM10022236_53020 [Microlunatus ginsengisoli]|uniref:Uncharacterized protein n=1 Tax=Microlunatus ginsengisoli TaxID=363863 RepID=A0ABP7AYP0_9ACTN
MSCEPVAEDRVFFRDAEPYAVVDSLDAMRGPPDGTIRLPHWVLWTLGREINHDGPGGRCTCSEVFDRLLSHSTVGNADTRRRVAGGEFPPATCLDAT